MRNCLNHPERISSLVGRNHHYNNAFRLRGSATATAAKNALGVAAELLVPDRVDDETETGVDADHKSSEHLWGEAQGRRVE